MMLHENPFLFLSKRNEHLSGVLHIPGNITDPPVLIMSHGFTDDKVSDNRLFVKFARQAQARGYAVLRFDYAGSGDSEGDFSDMTISREIQDLESAIEFVLTRPELMHSLIYLVGYSLGGAVALVVAARDSRVQGLVGWAPVSNPLAVFYAILGKDSFLTARTARRIACGNDSKRFFLKPDFFSDLSRHQPLRDIAKISPRPVLLLQGTADTKVLPEQTKALFSAAGEPKALHVIHKAPHSFAFHENELFETTLRHLDAWSQNSRQAAEHHRQQQRELILHPTG
jgi:alpha-beta hydrolase superfamily lysophospholipase